MGSKQRVIMGQEKRSHGRHSHVPWKVPLKLQLAQAKGTQPFTEAEIARFQDVDLPLSVEGIKAATRFRAYLAKKLRRPDQVFVSFCHSSAAAGMQEEHYAMTWGELAKVLNVFAPFASLQTVENQGVGLTLNDFKTWFWAGGERLVPAESSVMKKARLESSVLPPTKEAKRMRTADFEAKMLALQEQHKQEVQTMHRRMADNERCCAEVLEQQSAEGQKLKEERQKLQELQRAGPIRNACMVCFEPANWAIIPCGHTCFCANHGAAAKALGNPCPFCRGEIRDRLKVFLSGMDP